MRPIAVLLRFVASTALLLVSAYIMVTATLPVGDVVAQTIITHEAIIREGPPPPEVIVRQPPPPPREEMRVPPPSQVQVWVPGYWSWNNEWVWIQGRWERPPERRATWVPGQWVQRGEHGELWAWRSGHWE